MKFIGVKGVELSEDNYAIMFTFECTTCKCLKSYIIEDAEVARELTKDIKNGVLSEPYISCLICPINLN